MSTVSVVVPTYDSERFIGAALDSALNQTLPPHEIIVVDDGSADNTEEMMRAYGDRINYIKTPNSGYPSVVRNIGIEAASGEYVAFLDADDVWHPTKLADQIAVFNQYPSVHMVYCDHDYIDESGQLIRGAHPSRPSAIENGRIVPTDDYWTDVFGQLLLGGFIQTSTVMVRKCVLDDVGRFDSSLLFLEDLDLWLRIAYAGRVERLPAVRSSYRVHVSSLTHTRLTALVRDSKALNAKVCRLVGQDGERAAFVRRTSRLVLTSALVTTAYTSSGLSQFNRFTLLCQALFYYPRMFSTEKHVWKNAIKCAFGFWTGAGD